MRNSIIISFLAALWLLDAAMVCGQNGNNWISGSFIDDKLSYPRKEDVTILLHNNPLPGYTPNQHGAFDIDCSAKEGDHLIFDPDPILYFPRIVPYKRNATTMLYLTLNAVKHHYLRIQNNAGMQFHFYVNNAQITDSSQTGTAVELRLTMKAIPDTLIIAAVAKDHQTIIKKPLVNHALNTTNVSINPEDVLPARACVETDWEYDYAISIKNNTVEEFTYSSNEGLPTIAGENLVIKSTRPLKNIIITAVNPCFEHISKNVALTGTSSAQLFSIDAEDLNPLTTPAQISIVNKSGKKLVLEYKRELTIKNNRKKSIVIPTPKCASEIEVTIPAKGHLVFTKRTTLRQTPNGRTGTVYIYKDDVPDIDVKGPFDNQNMSLLYVEGIHIQKPQENYITVNSEMTHINNKNTNSYLPPINTSLLSYKNKIGLDVTAKVSSNSYYKSPHYQMQLVWNSYGKAESNALFAMDLSHYWASDKQWFRRQTLTRTSVGLNTGLSSDFSAYTKLGFALRLCMEFGEFDNYSNDPQADNFRFVPAILFTYQSIFQKHEFFVMTGTAREAFYSSALFSFFKKVNLSCEFKGNGLTTQPYAIFETRRFFKVGIGYHF